MADPDESKKILDMMPDNVGMLLDVAHLKVSAKTLGFNRSKMFSMCKNKIFGYHISENDGKRDLINHLTKIRGFGNLYQKK